MNIYLDLMRESFLSALAFSIVPEVRLFAMRLFGGYDMALATGLALLASLAGTLTTFTVGRLLGILLYLHGGPLMQARLHRGSVHGRTWGSLLLMVSWMPFFGPMIALILGVLSLPFLQFLIITLLGKAVYYGYWGLLS